MHDWSFRRVSQNLKRLVSSLMLGATISLLLPGCYVLSQAYHQNNLFNAREPVEEVRYDRSTSTNVRAKLDLVDDVLAYAKMVGLNSEDAYRYYVPTSQPCVSYTVEAAPVDKLELKRWWFPIVGDVPYLGFFNEGERDAKAKELKAEMLDVDTGCVDAFSSLGWFDDPLYTSMLRHDDAALAHLLFHELTHRTFWAPGASQFNENIAEYVAGVVTRRYLMDRGKTAELASYVARTVDEGLFRRWLKNLRTDLEDLYAHPPSGGRSALLAAKAGVFKKYLGPLLPDYHTESFKHIDRTGWNNATVLGEGLYAPDDQRFAKAQACFGDADIGHFLKALHQRLDDYSDAFAALDSFCAKPAVTTKSIAHVD